MSSRNRTIWLLLIIFSTLSFVLASIRLFPLSRDWKQAKIRAERTRFGTDKELEGVIEFLETRLHNRNQYQFQIESEPMRLTNVLMLEDAYGRLMRYHKSSKIRVTAIIDGKTQQAIIQYRDRHHTVSVGDSIGGGEVVWIDNEEVVIVDGNKEVHYQVAGLAAPGETEIRKTQRSKQ